MDILTKEKRSWNMSRIRSKNTSPERIVRSALHCLGYRFRLHSHALPGSPDVVLPRYKIAIFVNGCFWHRHKNCRYAYTPKTRQDFWKNKFEENKKRDREVKKELQKLGWKPVIIWECQTKDRDKFLIYISNILKDRIISSEISFNVS